MKEKRKIISLKDWVHYLFFEMRRHKRISLLVYIIYYIYRVSQKKCTNRMLLEPWCTGSTTSGWHHLSLESVFLVVSY